MFTLDSVFSVIAPHECMACGQEKSLLCEACRYDLLDIVPARCYRCMAKTKDSRVCSKCRHVSPLRHVWVSTEYQGEAKELVRLYKFERAMSAHSIIASHIAETLPYLETDTIITFIPTATSRQRMRGYDQSKLIAKQLAKLKRVKFIPLLERYGQSRQVGSTRKQRQVQATEMFRLAKQIPASSDVIIIDDIVTTGASIEAAARLLKKAGAKHVSAAVFAQKH